MNLKLNKTIKYLIYSDLVFYTGWGLISPIFAIFILNTITGGSAFIVGLASAIHLTVRSLVRIPFGMNVDSKKSFKRAFNFMFYGLLFSALIPLGYMISKTPLHIYILQAFLGIFLAMSTAGWTAIFSRNMDKGKESTEWGFDAVAVGIGPGIAGAIGGLAVTYFPFAYVFITVSIIGIIGAFLLLFIKKDVLNCSFCNGKLFTHRELRRLKKRLHH